MTDTYVGAERRSGRERRVIEMTQAQAQVSPAQRSIAQRVDTHGNVRSLRAEGGSLVRLSVPGVLIGAGMAGLADSVVFHHLLQWHHVNSGPFVNGQLELTLTSSDLTADGVVELLSALAIAIGLGVLWAAGKRPHSLWRVAGASFFGWIMVGWSMYNVLVVALPAFLMDRHHVNVVGGGQLGWDLVWLGLSLALGALGMGLAMQGRPRDVLHDDWAG